MNNTLNKLLLILAFTFSGVVLYGQDPVFDQDVDEQMDIQETSPNKGFSNYFNFRYGYTLPIPENDSMQTKYGDGFGFGFDYLWSPHKRLGFGFGYFFSFQNFNIKQDTAQNLMSLGFEHDRQLLRQFRFDLTPKIRLRYGKSGNSLGKYVDLGGYAGVTFGYSEYLFNKVDPALNRGAAISEVTNGRLKYLNRWEYGLQGRLGFNRFYIFGTYRMSDMFVAHEGINQNKALPDLPRLQVGIGLSSWMGD